MIKGRDLLIYYAVKFEGDWNEIYNAMKVRLKPDPEELEAVLKSVKANTLTVLDEDYPKRFEFMTCPPFVLFYYGDISLIADDKNSLAVIGSRNNTDYGKEMTEYLVSGVAKDYIIVSGMAIGIDSIGQEACIKAGGKTVAVLGSGIDYCYPARNKELYETIKKDHLVISEYPNDTKPEPIHFTERNRIIAAIPSALLVPEAHNRSGTLSTVSHALQLGKPIFCVPHMATSDSLCNALIKDGALLVETPEEVIDNYNYFK